jgi:putative hydrolase of the HAD superfamily
MIPYGSTKRILMKPREILWFDGRLSHQGISKELFKVEIDNLKLYGYGIKGYILSMIEAAMTISNNTILKLLRKSFNTERITRKPIVLLDGVEETLEALRKIQISGCHQRRFIRPAQKITQFRFGSYFHHIEVMSDKQVDYSD